MKSVAIFVAVICATLPPAALQSKDRVSTDELEPLSGTKPLDWPQTDDALADRLMDGAHQFVERKIGESRDRRSRRWKYDLASPAAYIRSIAANRARFKKMIGVIDSDRVTPARFERYGTDKNGALAGRGDSLRIYQVRWPVLAGVFADGLMVEPPREPQGYTFFLPDADQTPEQLAGLGSETSRLTRRVRRAAADGHRVLIPTLISRRLYLSPDGSDTRLDKSRQSCREWIYRQAFQMGRHIIGYEVQEVMAAVARIRQLDPDTRIHIEGIGEGALIAFYAAACDPQIDSVVIHGYFGSRERVWSEPIFRNVFGLLREFGDAEIASLIYPRSLTIQREVNPTFKDEKGEIGPFDPDQVRSELNRLPEPIRSHVHFRSEPLSEKAEAIGAIADLRMSFDPGRRHDRLLKQMESYTQSLVRGANLVRQEFFLYKAEPRLRPGKWSTNRRHPTLDPAPFIDAADRYRTIFHEQLMGQFDERVLPPNARTRKILETDSWTAYDVVLDVYAELFAWGVLVVPKGLAAGEQRPVVVCQHGRNGLPRKTLDAHATGYYDVAARLAEQGYITFAPHNLYRGEDRYRWLDRKANTIGCTLFTFIIDSHGQILRWLKSLPFVDARKIAFYGLSYGGETAMRVPAILPDYCLSICSGDFNQWTRKVAATDFPHGFMRSIEWEMPYWNLGPTFDYAEMAYLIFPRPFMVERGHHDLVSQDHWVAHEYAKVRFLYDQFDMADRTRIEFFQGGHAMNAEGTFEFLRHHLK